MANLKHVPIEDAIHKGWEITKKKFWFLAGLLIIMTLFQLPYDITKDGFGLNLGTEAEPFRFFDFVMTVISIILEMGLITIILKLLDNKTPSYADLFANIPKFVTFFLGSVLYMIVVTAGLILFIIPGIIFAIKYQYYSYLILDKDMGVFKAFEESGKMTQGIKWQLLVFATVTFFINLVGALALGVGLFLSIPTTWIANAYVYRHLAKRHHAKATHTDGEASATA